jgi:hypothetical protein
VIRRSFFRLALVGAIALEVASNASALDAKSSGPVVRGRVTSAAKPLAEVLVSNGRQVTRTDAAGCYALPTGPDVGRFVFVCCPRGHWTDRFYRPIDEAARPGGADFALRPVPQPDRFEFVFAADVHLERYGEQAVRKTKASIAEICSLSPKPAFLWIQGDLDMLDGGDQLLDCLKTSTIPVRMGIGNHEIRSSAKNPKVRYERVFGPTYYSFDWGPVHFIVLDGNRPAHIRGNSVGAVEGREWAWLEADLATQPPGKPIIVGVHIPIVSTYPARRPELKETEAPFWQSANGLRLASLLARHRVRLVLQGHNHENERITQDGVEYAETVSLCGRWWRAGEGFERATDGSPRGYRVVSVDGNQIRHRYQSSCESRVERQGEFVDLSETITPDADTSFVFSCYDAPNGSTAQARVDNGPWRAMPQVVLQNSGVPKPHHWQLTVDTTALAAGPHTIDARVTWPDGTVTRRSASFRVGPSPANEPSCEER